MKMNRVYRPVWNCLLIIVAWFSQSCGWYDENNVEKYFEGLTWGGWLLQETITTKQEHISASNLGYEQYLERKYDGWTVTGPTQRTEIDSVILYKNRQVIFRSRVAERLSTDNRNQKIVYKLMNNQYYWIQFVGVDGPEDGAGNDQLLVSEFVNSREELDKATIYKYVRTNLGERPW